MAAAGDAAGAAFEPADVVLAPVVAAVVTAGAVDAPLVVEVDEVVDGAAAVVLVVVEVVVLVVVVFVDESAQAVNADKQMIDTVAGTR